MKQNSFKAFGLSFLLSLGILVPLLGGFVLYTGWQTQKTEATQQAQSGVPLRGPTAENDLTILVAIAAEQPGFVLLRINAMESRVDICPLPAESVLLSPSGTTLLGKSYQAAGPARAAVLLGQTLGIQIDRYLAITPATIGAVWGQTEPPRVNLSGLLEKSQLAAQGLTAEPVLSIAPSDATAYLNGLDLTPARLASLRAAVWEAALRQQLEALVTALPAALRKNAGSLLTDCTATDFYTLEETLGFLARQEVSFDAQAMAGRFDAGAQRFEFDEASMAQAQRVFPPAQSTAAPDLQEVTPAPAVPDEIDQTDEMDENQPPTQEAPDSTALPSAEPTANPAPSAAAPSPTVQPTAQPTPSPTPLAEAPQDGAASVVIGADGATPTPSPTPTIPTAGGLG